MRLLLLHVVTATSSECYLDRHIVKTFDGLTLPFTPSLHEVATSDCKLLISKDCSGAGHFAVLASGPPSSWKLRFLVPGQEIEWIWREVGSLEVTVNGEEKNFRPFHPIIIRKEPKDTRYTEQFDIKLLQIVI